MSSNKYLFRFGFDLFLCYCCSIEREIKFYCVPQHALLVFAEDGFCSLGCNTLILWSG